MKPQTVPILLATFAGLVLPSTAARTRDLQAEAEAATRSGHFAVAIPLWETLLRDPRTKRDPAKAVEIKIQLAVIAHSQGNFRQAREILGHALNEAEKTNDAGLVARVQSARGMVLAGKTHGDSEKLLRDAVATLRKGKPNGATARACNNLASFLALAGKHDEAAEYFEEAIGIAEKTNQPELALIAEANWAGSEGRAQRFHEAIRHANAVLAASAKMPHSHEHAMAVIRAGVVLETISGYPEGRQLKTRAQALTAFQGAAAIARGLDDTAAASQALGAAGRLYETEHRWDEALQLTRQAIFHAQSGRSGDLLFRWNWQAGRLLREKGELDSAIAALRSARTELDNIRHDLALHFGNPMSGTSFREVTGGLFFDLADLLLRKADSATGDGLQRLLLEARDSAEALKSAELEDYFQDECVSLLRQKITKLEELSEDAVVVYVIPLRDRTETLLTIGHTVTRIKSSVPGPQVEAAATRLRRLLETRTSNEYLEPAKQLNDWLITPLEPALAKAKPKTLVFVPDGALRTIPMGALHDGQRFLIERYSIAVTPGLTLLEPKPIARDRVEVMMSGLSEARQDFPALPYVPEEIEHLRKLYGGQPLLNRDFVLPRVKDTFTKSPFNIVHIASHGHFDRDAAKTFVLTFDEKMTLDDLERLLQPARLRNQPVELLSLSACQTAAGDDRAALGLAGIAIKAGARSAFATLWFVNDEASARLVTDFYGELRRSPQLNKAQALQAAQKRLLADPRYEHPCYWAPYLIIGNWL